MSRRILEGDLVKNNALMRSFIIPGILIGGAILAMQYILKLAGFDFFEYLFSMAVAFIGINVLTLLIGAVFGFATGNFLEGWGIGLMMTIRLSIIIAILGIVIPIIIALMRS